MIFLALSIIAAVFAYAAALRQHPYLLAYWLYTHALITAIYYLGGPR